MASILLLQDGEPKARFSLLDRTVIGRSSVCEIQILNPGLSRSHAVIERREDAYYIADAGSQNGTFVGGVRIEAALRLSDGDDIQLGAVSFIFNAPVDVLHESMGDKTVCVIDDAAVAPPLFEGLAEGPAPPHTPQELTQVLDIACDLASELNLDKLLPILLKKLMTHFGARRGFILTLESSGAWIPRAVISDKRTAAVSRTLMDRALSSQGPLLYQDAVEHLSFVGARSVLEHKLCAVMLLPLFSRSKVPLGMIQLDSPEPGAFTRETLARLALLAKPAALAMENARRFENELRKQQAEKRSDEGASGIITEDSSMQALLDSAARAAQSNARVLIVGESGTGKELIARMIHQLSARADKPFVAVNCGAILETVLESELFGHEKGAFTGAVKKRRGCFELADGGTLFLDEVGELSPTTQVKLLRVLQEGIFYPVGAERPLRVDVRVAAATNRDLKKLVTEGRFREDLYFRLKVIELAVPPLRARRRDVLLLADAFLERYAKSLSRAMPKLTSAVRGALESYDWPGNVRELQNNMERLAVLVTGEEIGMSDLPPEIVGARTFDSNTEFSGMDLKEAVSALERRMIVEALRGAGKKKAEACRRLGISRPTLDKKLLELGIDLTEDDPPT